MADEDLKLKVGEPTPLDRAMAWFREKPLTEEELSGFVKAGRREPDKGFVIRPFANLEMPSKEDGPKGVTVTIGVKGTF